MQAKVYGHKLSWKLHAVDKLIINEANMDDHKMRQYIADQFKLFEYLNHVFNDSSQIGLLYERYIGYLYETAGYRVEYSGIKKGLEDLGRDLLAFNGSELLVIQCKRWTRSALIHEKHIYQLYGTTAHLQKTLKNKARPVLVSSGELSNEAKCAAKDLGVEVRLESFRKNYPMVKCNINHHGMLYHLPFGKWYDSVQIDLRVGDSYAYSVEDAVDRGFCSAYLNRKRSA